MSGLIASRKALMTERLAALNAVQADKRALTSRYSAQCRQIRADVLAWKVPMLIAKEATDEASRVARDRHRRQVNENTRKYWQIEDRYRAALRELES